VRRFLVVALIAVSALEMTYPYFDFVKGGPTTA
jgi:hypothetical protein